MYKQAIESYWNEKLSNLKQVLEENNFEAWIAESEERAHAIVTQDIYNSIQPSSVSFGGSLTV